MDPLPDLGAGSLSGSHSGLFLYILKYVKHNTTTRLLYLLLSLSGRVFPQVFSWLSLSLCNFYFVQVSPGLSSWIDPYKIAPTHHSLPFNSALAFLHSTYSNVELVLYLFGFCL